MIGRRGTEHKWGLEPFVLREVLGWVVQNWSLELKRCKFESWERTLANSVFSLKLSVPIKTVLL